ncbi:hypothetical protein XGA_3809 [Xanthomonas hortorum ATCC 19865]|nr:hypothetical protein XGA_3809 [Xanthomonas hortorum ATCC 19865]
MTSVFGVIQPGADFQVLYRMFQAYRHADASRRIGHHRASTTLRSDDTASTQNARVGRRLAYSSSM